LVFFTVVFVQYIDMESTGTKMHVFDWFIKLVVFYL